jgi:single-stranded-DNA-specific exonuclease
VGARDVAFRIAPRLNAPGRLGQTDLALELLLCRSLEAARSLAGRIEGLSERRRALQEEMAAAAIEEIEREGWAERGAIVVGREGWSSGIVGIVAGRLADRYARPVVVVGFDGGLGRGSVRGPAGSRLHDAVAAVSGCLERFGGHQAAAGLEIRLERLAELRTGFERAVAAGAPIPVADLLADTVLLAVGDEPARVVSDIERLEPWGQGNPAPRVVVQGRVGAAREVRGGHLQLRLLVGNSELGCFGVGMGGLAASLAGDVAVVGDLRRDSYRGGTAVELFLQRVLDGHALAHPV